jgi:hypothetical protein
MFPQDYIIPELVNLCFIHSSIIFPVSVNMQLQALLVSALAATASAYRISVYSSDNYQGTQRSYVSQPRLKSNCS